MPVITYRLHVIRQEHLRVPVGAAAAAAGAFATDYQGGFIRTAADDD